MEMPSNDMETKLANTYCHISATLLMTVTNHQNWWGIKKKPKNVK